MADQQQLRQTGPSPSRLIDHLALLSEMTRLRLLRILEMEELSVGELAAILQLPQSTVSRHLKGLLESDWVVRRSEGTAGRYRLIIDQLEEVQRELWKLARRQLSDSTPQLRQDASRLQQVLQQRKVDTAEYFGRVGGEWDRVRTELFGRALAGSALLGLLPREWVVADIGCGSGNLTAMIAPFVREVHAVDLSRQMLAAAKKRLAGLENVHFHQGDLLNPPLRQGSCDAVIISLVLHHVSDPRRAIESAVQLLKPQGRLLVIDMIEHGRTEYRQTMGHLWLGFDPREMERWATGAGLVDPSHHQLPTDPQARGPELFLLSAGKKG